MVTLRHATPRRNLPSIRRLGLLCAKSRGRLPAVWLHAPSKSAWATLHVVKRHGGRVEGVVILEFEVPRRWLRRNRRRLWYTPRDVGPERLRRVIGFSEVAASPVEEAAPARALTA
jgi:hypothetical protein